MYIAFTNLVSHTYEIGFHDVIGQSTEPMYSYAKIPKHGRLTWSNEYVLESYFFFFFIYLIRWIELCDKKNLTFVDCCDKFLLKLVLKNVIKLAKGSTKTKF